jgi:type II secretory pathway component PulJ
MNGRAVRGAGREGFTLIEVVVTGALMMAAMTLLAQSMVQVAANRRLVERHTLALNEVDNLMERLTAADWSRGTPEWATKPEMTDEARRMLPHANLTVQISTPEGDPEARRVEVALRSGEPAATLARLVCWVYAKGARP